MAMVVLSMATVCFMFGLIAITRVDKVVEEDQQFGSSLGIFKKHGVNRFRTTSVIPG